MQEKKYKLHYISRGENINFKIIALIINTTDPYTKIAKDLNISRQCVYQMATRLKEVNINFPIRK